jgi:protein-disulfide isomerase
MDDRVGTVAAGFGMSGTPFFVVLDGDNRNLGRVSGEIGIEGIEALVAIARSAGD